MTSKVVLRALSPDHPFALLLRVQFLEQRSPTVYHRYYYCCRLSICRLRIMYTVCGLRRLLKLGKAYHT